MSDLTETDFPPLEPQPFVTEEGREIQRLRAELAAAKAELASRLMSCPPCARSATRRGFASASCARESAACTAASIAMWSSARLPRRSHRSAAGTALRSRKGVARE